MVSAENKPPLGLYVHVPFCEQKCAYCDFFTITDPAREHPLLPDWLGLCLQELRLWFAVNPAMGGHQITTVYFGGGTPSLLPPAQFATFLRELREEFGLNPAAEISLETQPGTLAPDDFHALREAGINRFSTGVQTFNPRHLQPTARRHTVEQSEQAILNAKETGATVSLDLICALPGQSLAEWEADVRRALAFEPHHMSVYEMTYHAGTDYYRQWRRGRITETAEEARIAMFGRTRELLAGALEQYEISNYSGPGYESQHNSIYWTLQPFVGLGPGAHSFIGGRRFANPRHAGDYARALGEGRLFARPHDSADPDITLAENLQMALRLRRGMELEVLAERLGQDIRVTRRRALDEAIAASLLEIENGHLRLTETGMLQADSVTEMFL